MGLRRGHKQAQVGVIPEDWDEIPLSELLDFRNGANAAKHAYGIGVRFINVLEVITHSHIRAAHIPGRVSLPKRSIDAYQVQRGDIVFNRTSETQDEVGLSAVYDDDETVVFGGFVIRGRPKTRLLDAIYSGYALRSPAIRAQIVAKGQGAIRANVGQADLRRVVAPLPPLPEQCAIAAALGDVDTLVGALEKLIAKKHDLKQATMQRLLTGKARLPGFHGEWEPSTIGGEFEIQLGKMLDSEKNRGVAKPYLGNRAVQWGRIDATELPMMAMSGEDMKRFRLRRGDLLVCEGGEVGRAAIWDAEIEECYYQKALHRLRPKRGFEPRLMLALLRYWTDEGVLTDYVTQTSIAHLTREKLAEVRLPVPKPSEQTAIAGVLSDMDAEIAALEARLAKTQALKQGMMQELLTGRIRLPVPA